MNNLAEAAVRDSALELEIGAVPLRLTGLSASLWLDAHRRYFPFEAANTGALEVAVGGAPRFANASFRHALNAALLELSAAGAHVSGVQTVYEIDSFLRILLSQVLLPESGFLLHAATVERNGRAFIFMGRSGAGKSTIAAQAPCGSVFTDEISLVRHYGGWQAFGTPFWGEFRADGQNRCAPVGGIFSLEQANENRVEVLAPRKALGALLGNTLFFSAAGGEKQCLLGTLMNFVRSVPVYRLQFKKDCSFWEVLR